MQNIENKMNNENINKPIDTKEIEKLKKKRAFDRMIVSLVFQVNFNL